MDRKIKDKICSISKANKICKVECIQKLWSDYGDISRYFLEGGELESIIIKQIKIKSGGNHPRGWDTDASHLRKLKSYEIECNWYEGLARKSDSSCYIPSCYAIMRQNDRIYIFLEDLKTSGFSIQKESLSWEEFKSCLDWLANFHAIYLNEKPIGLWEQGNYWHLDTRQDEWNRMKNQDLKKHAQAIDSKLKNCQFKTIIHGDAKLANFCFSESSEVAAVDFQYVGQGSGIQDLVYFMSSCLSEDDCFDLEEEVLSYYFKILQTKIASTNLDAKALEKEWRTLYSFAWADFIRFLDGWSPNHWKENKYSLKQCKIALDSL